VASERGHHPNERDASVIIGPGFETTTGALEEPEIASYRDLWRAAPPDLAGAYGIEDADLEGIHCECIVGLPDSRLLNHAFGLPHDRPLADRELDAVESFFGERGLPARLGLAEGAAAEQQLVARGYVRDYPWMVFVRDTSPPPAVDCEVEVRPVAPGDAVRMGEILAASFGLPATLGPWLAALVGRPVWRCLGAYDGDGLVATGSLFVHGDAGCLTWGATDPEHRGRRAQKALLAARVSLARELGLRMLVTQTGDAEPGRVDASFRNILGAGFEPAFRRPNWRLDPA
jgi:hypothetical protein